MIIPLKIQKNESRDHVTIFKAKKIIFFNKKPLKIGIFVKNILSRAL